MFGYYGSKSKIVNYYPEPIYDTIIEPFAGSAQYSLKYWNRQIILFDKYDVIVRIWKWLQQCSSNDILSLPHIQYGQTLNDFQWDCMEAKWLMGFLITGAPSTPKLSPSKWKTIDRPNTLNYKLNLITNNLPKIKHWKIYQDDYLNIPNQKATWFIDPPYQVGGQYYKCSNKDIDYDSLRTWCQNREGQVIVCENNNATWMDFKPLTSMTGCKRTTIECLWTNTVNTDKIILW